MTKQPMFKVSADAKTLASVLREAKVGDSITYERLSRSIARDVQTDARGALMTARRLVMGEDRLVFDAIRGEGLVRLKDEQIVSLSDRARDHIRRTSRKTAKALVCVDYDSLSPEMQVKHNTGLSMLGVIAELSTSKSIAKLESKVKEAGAELPLAKAAIAALGSSIS